MIGEAQLEGRRRDRWGVPRCSRGRGLAYVRLAVLSFIAILGGSAECNSPQHMHMH